MNWPEFECTKEPTKYGGLLGFRVGTCQGLWQITKDAYEVIAVVNVSPGNGHFKKTMQYFETSARRDGLKVRVRETWNPWLAARLRKNGYTRVRWTLFTYEKDFKNI